MTNPQIPPAGWYPDPDQPAMRRYWSGREWTSQTAPPTSPASGRAPVTPALSTRPWWQTWWAIVPGLVLCFPIGLVGLWLRSGTSPRAKGTVTVVVIGLFTMGIAAPDTAWDEARDSEASPTDTPSTEPELTTVTRGPLMKKVVIPALETQSLRDARPRLNQLGVTLVVAARRPSLEPAGSILRQSVKPGARVVPGAVVRVVVARPLPRVVRVVGLSAASAAARLRRAGFRVVRTTSMVTSGRSGAVLSQSPVAGTPVRPGAVVTIEVTRVVPALSDGGGNCTPGYSPCLLPASDYDCAGGSGNGPEYVYGTVTVTGSDPYDLDRDGDGYGCD